MIAEYKTNHDRIEIYFDCDPEDNIVETLENSGWRWIKARFCWRNKKNKENLAFAKEICNGKKKTDNRIIYQTKFEKNLEYSECIVGIICAFTDYEEKDIVVSDKIADECCNGISLKYEKNLVIISDGDYTIVSEGYYCPRCHKLYFNKKTLNRQINTKNSSILFMSYLAVSISAFEAGERLELSPVTTEISPSYIEAYNNNIAEYLVQNAFIKKIDISNVTKILARYGYNLDSFNDLPVNDQLNNDLIELYKCHSLEDICSISTNKVISFILQVIDTGKLDKVLISDFDDKQERRILFIYPLSDNMYLEYSIPCSITDSSNGYKQINISSKTITVKFICEGMSSSFQYTLPEDEESIIKFTSTDKYKKLCSNINNGILDDSDSYEDQEARILNVADFLVRSTNYSCTNYKHAIIRINAAVKVKTPDGIYGFQVPAAYCPKCNRYYILERYYDSLRKHGYICCKIDMFDTLQKNDGTIFDTFHDKSILSIYGYNVDRQKGLSEKERHTILDFIIDNEIQTTQQVINHLEQNISLRKHDSSMKSAIQKWEKDIEYVRTRENIAKVVKVDSIMVPVKRIILK